MLMVCSCAATALKALKILGLEPRQQALTKQDFIIFLYAMGLVGAALQSCCQRVANHASGSSALPRTTPHQNPTEDIIDSKLRAFKLHHKKHFTFGQLAHVW